MPPLDYDSQEEDEGGQQGGATAFPKLLGKEGGEGGPEKRRDHSPGEKKIEDDDQEEDQEKDTRSPRTLLLSNVKRFKEKASQVSFSQPVNLVSFKWRMQHYLHYLKEPQTAGLLTDSLTLYH